MKRYVLSRCVKWLGIFLLAGGVIFYILQLAPPDPSQVVLAKPVIYLYPEKAQETRVNVELIAGTFTVTEPALQDGWQVTAYPDGTLVDEDGRTWPYLFWEADSQGEFQFEEGFVVPGQDTGAFLEKALAVLGLNEKERQDFLEYWLPLMEKNPYNQIAFQQEEYTSLAALIIDPAPDTLIRVFMAWKGLQEPVEMKEQVLTPVSRQGYTAVEWGGTQVK